ncbi:MAG: PQQ-dependent sugar dehydrogenase [Chloroflexota bacterium]
MSRYILPLILFAALLSSCTPTTSDITITPVTGESVQPEPTGALPTIPPPQQVEAAATQTFVPVVQSDEPGEATPTPDLSAPTETPQPTATPRTPISSIRVEPVLAGGLDRPLYLTHAFDDRMFVVEQPGRIRIIENGQLVDQPFLDIQDRVGSVGNEQGLLSVAFHPQYAQEGTNGFGKFYVNYTDYSGNSHISRFSVSPDNPDIADKSSEVVLLTVQQPYTNHNGGMLAFGPDGYLYAGFGDGGDQGDPQNNGQTPATLLGTLLRLDVGDGGDAYSIPADNPFVEQSAARSEVWAYGLRNPWRFSFDRVTGDLYIADVGQNQWEEINFQPQNSTGGENYGWNLMEGLHCYATDPCDPAGLVLPITEYGHDQGCSVTGGYVYRGQAYPEMIGNYFFADYCTGIIWRTYPDGTGGWETVQVLDSDLVLTSFGEDVNGELYALDRTTGGVYRVIPGN